MPQDPAEDLVTEETRQAEAAEADDKPHADRMPTEEEERIADQHDLDPAVAESYKKAAETGANAKGEGRI